MTMPSGRNITVSWNHSHAGWKQRLRTGKRIMWWHQVRTFMDTGLNQWIHCSYRIMVCSRNDAGIAFMLMLSCEHENACQHYDLNELEPQECDSLMFTLWTLSGDRHEIFNGLLIWCHFNHQESIHWGFNRDISELKDLFDFNVNLPNNGDVEWEPCRSVICVLMLNTLNAWGISLITCWSCRDLKW